MVLLKAGWNVRSAESWPILQLKGIAMAYATVKYSYRSPLGTKSTTSYSGKFPSESETLVMQKLRDKHKGAEITLVKLQWKK